MYEKELEQAGLKVGKSQAFNPQNINKENGYQKQMDSLNQYNSLSNNSNNDAINKSLFGQGNTATEPFRINRKALADAEFVPAGMEEEYNQANNFNNQWLNNLNIATEEEIEEWRAKGKMSFGETISRLSGAGAAVHFLPYVGSTVEVAQDVKLMNTMNKMRKGEKVSDEEQEQLIEYLRNLKEMQVRGSTIGSNVFNVLYESIPFAVEFGLGLWGGGSGTAYSLSQKGARLAARKAFKEVLRKELAEGTEKSVLSAARNVYKDVYKNTYSQALKGGVARGVKELGAKETLKTVGKQFPKDIAKSTVGNPLMAYMTGKNAVGNYAERQLSSGIEITDAGLAVFKEPENKATSIMRALGSSIFDNVTETMGWTFRPLQSFFAKPVQKLLPAKFFTEFDKLVSSRFGMKATDALHKYGYDGVIEEMGEELLNRFLCQVFNINGDYTFDGFMNNVFYKDNPSQWVTEALSFALMSGAGHGIVGLNSIIREKQQENKNNKDIETLLDLYNSNHYSLAEYYLDQGLIKLNGSKSLAEQKLLKRLEKLGIPEEVAQDYADTLSENDKREALKNYPDTTETLTEAIVEQLEKTGYQGKISKEKAAELMANIIAPQAEALNYTPEEVLQELPYITQSENYSYFDNRGNAIQIEDIERKYKEYSDIYEALPETTPDNVINDVTTALNILDDMRKGVLSESDAAKAAVIFDSNLHFQESNENNRLEELADYYENNFADEVYNQAAEYAGAETPTEAQDAKREYQEKGTESKYFKKWFGDSKVVDENGKPLVVYHGTENNFKIFKNLGQSRQIGANVGFFFTDSENMAKEYANNKRVMPTYLSLQNPLIVEPNSTVEMFGENIEITDAFDFFTQMDTRVSEQDLKNELIKQGYDGVILRNTNVDTPFMQDIHDVYVAFDNTQIKSVNNRGTFDAENPNIYYQSAYHGSPYKFDEFSTDFMGKGEGAQAHGWGLYFAGNKEISERYRKKLTEHRYNYDILEDGKPINSELSSYLNNNLGGSTLSHATEDMKPFREYIRNYINRLENGENYENKLIEMFQNEIDRIEANPKMSISKFIETTPDDDRYRFKTMLDYIRKTAKQENRKANINDMLKRIKDVQAPFIRRKNIEIGIANDLKAINWDKVVIKRAEGQLFEVDIPEDDVLLDEDKYFGEQSEKVQQAIRKICEDYSDNNKLIDLNVIAYTNNTREKYKDTLNYKEGRNIYSIISDAFGGDKQASELLNQYGIKGITYDGLRDGRCYVIFDDKAINVLQRYYQSDSGDSSEEIFEGLQKEHEKLEYEINTQTSIFDNVNDAKKIHLSKGSFLPIPKFIELYKNADESTFVHELAHWWLDALVTNENKSERIAEDLATIRKWLKNDGGKFTQSEHEKFARGFEAYLRNGSAQNNKLKKIFEDFKNWLLKIYDDIRQLGVAPEELGEIENVFNKILTTERERIQAAVFDKVNNIQEEIDTIKANQEVEFAELERLEKNNIESNLRYQQYQAKVKEYLNKAAKQAARVPKSVQEVRNRYKDVTFQILETATGMKRQQIANPRNWEKVEKLIEGNDNFSGGGGFQSEWSEFYLDTGVSYDNQELGADDELAMQAFEVMKNGNYNFAETGFDVLDDAEIGQFFGMFDYLSDKVLKLKGAEKDYAMEALTELCNKIPSAPDEVMKEIVEKLQEISDTYVEQKANERSNSSMRNVSLETQFRAYIIDKIHNMKYYDTEEKRYARMSSIDKLYNMISAATNLYNAKEIVRRINNRAIEELENKQKSILAKEIQKQVKIGSKTVKSGQVQKGKFDWRTNTVFAKLRDLNKLSLEEARKEFEKYTMLDEVVKGEEREDINEDNVKTFNHPKTEEDRLFCSFLEYKASKIKEMNVLATRNLLEKILELKTIGRKAKSEADFKKAFEREDLKQGLADIVTEKLKDNKNAKRVAKFVGNGGVTLANWETILTVLFDRDTARKYSLLELESKAEVYAHNKTVEMFNVIRDVYGIKKRANDNLVHRIQNTYDRMVDFDAAQDIIKLFNEYDKETITVREQTWNKDTLEVKETNQELSHSQIMMLYGWSLNGNLKERLINTYGEIQLDYMFSTLSEQDKELMKRLSQFCDTMYDDTNEVFINTTGLSLPKVENYLPSKTERCGSDLDLFGERVVRASNFSATKLRKTCNRIKMKPLNPMQVLIPHINKTARYVILSERLNYLNRLFCDNPLIEKALEDAFSESVVTFNSSSGYDYVHNTKTGERVKLELNKDIKINSIRPKQINITKIPFKISDKPSENKKGIINELNLNDNSYNVKNVSSNETIVIDKKTIEKSIANVKRNNTDYETFLKILLNTKDLFASSQKILSHKDIKSDTDLIVDRYANIVNIDGKNYLLEYVVKNREEAYLYSVNTLDKKKATSPNASKVIDLSAPDVATNSIRYIQDVFKSKLVEQYNKDWKQKEVASRNAQNKKKGFIENLFGKRKENVGAKLARIMRNQLAASTYENYARTYSVTSDLLNTIGNNFVTSAIGGNLKVTLTQLISVINYSEDMPVATWAKGFGAGLANPKETIKFMMDNCEYLSARLAGNSQNEVMVNLVNEAGKLRNLRKFWVSNTKYGDILAIIFGGKPYVDYLMNKRGLSKEEAFKKFVEATLRSQQSGHASATSAWQKDQSRNGIAKIVLGAFNNTNLQYERKWIEAVSNATKGDISKGEFIKAFLIYKVFNPIMFTSIFTNLALSALINGLIQGDDEPEEVWKSFGLDLGLAVLLSNVKAYGWAGILASTILSIGIGSLTEQDVYVSNKLPILSDIEDAARKIFGKGVKGELETADWLAITASVANLSGQPVERLYKEAQGVSDFAQGEYQKGIYEMLGYGDYRATIGATGKPPERR